MYTASELVHPTLMRNELVHHLVQGRYGEEPRCLTTAANSQALLSHYCFGREDLPAAIQTDCLNHASEHYLLSKTVVQ